MVVARQLSLMLLIIFSALCCWRASGTEASDALKRQVLEEAPKAWEKLRKRATNMSAVVVMTTDAGGGENAVGRYTTKSRGRCKLFIEERVGPAPKPRTDAPEAVQVHVYGINDHYYFYLRAASREGPYKVVKLEKVADDSVTTKSSIALVRRMWDSENFRLAVEIEALPEIFRKSYFELLSAEAIEEDGKRFIRCRINYDHSRDEKVVPFGVPLSYTSFQVDLDPRNDYGIRRVTTEVDRPVAKATYVLVDELREATPGEAGVYLREFKSVDKATNKILGSTKYEFLELSYASPPKSDFYLSAFGLPEPPGVRNSGVPVFVWVGGAGIVLVVIALVVQRWRK